MANSQKHSGYCVAGRELRKRRPKGWLRPVSNREFEEVSKREQKYKGGGQLQLLDVIDVSLTEPKPNNHQTENWLLATGYRWKKHGHFKWINLDKLTDPISNLWFNGQSSGHGVNDRMDFATAMMLDHSLRLVKLSALQIFVSMSWKGERRVQACFRFNRQDYRLAVTDPVYKKRFLQMGDGKYELGECYATISVGEPFKGHCYKLVIAIFEPLH